MDTQMRVLEMQFQLKKNTYRNYKIIFKKTF
jgi:hypothetical protein